MTSTNATRTIEELRKLFTAHGLPEQLVSDNGPQFIADEFRAFMRSNSIKHIKSAPYHPATNGLAERFVQTLKQALLVAMTEKKPLSQKLQRAKKFVSDSPRLVDFAVGLVDSILHLPDGQVEVFGGKFEEIKLQKHCKTSIFLLSSYKFV